MFVESTVKYSWLLIIIQLNCEIFYSIISAVDKPTSYDIFYILIYVSSEVICFQCYNAVKHLN